VALLLVLPAAVLAAGDQSTKYPFDPACAWGRLSNGKGMFHRCIGEQEARRLAKDEKKPKNDDAKNEKKPKGGEPADKKALPEDYEITVGPIAAEEGEITVGRLHIPIDRYRQCIIENGGLESKSAKVVVKFLVRAERVRAEGVSVESYEKVSSAAAECIATVVDRRQVGVPSVPLTAARLTFQIKEKR
jgi:hypothetical protein